MHLPPRPRTGRGVFATCTIPAHTTIDISPILLLDAAENRAHVERTALYHYTYNWPDPTRAGATTQAVVFGLGSMFNHAARAQNVGWTRDVRRGVVVYRTLREVLAGEELCISYGGRLTFVDVDERDREEEEREVGEEVLGRIRL